MARDYLVAAGEYLRENHPKLLSDDRLCGHFHHGMFHGFDFDNTMLRIGSMNMLRHGVENPDVHYRVVDILDRADALRAKRRAVLQHVAELPSSMLASQFGDPLYDSNGAETATLSTLCKRITDGTHQPPKWSVAGYPFLFVSNIVSGEINFETSKFISEETHADLTRRCPIAVGDVLYSTVGSHGVPALVRANQKFAFQRHIAHLKPDPAKVDSRFLCAMLGSPALKRQADRVARGVAQKTVNLVDIRHFVVFCPPLEDQREFANRLEAVQQLKAMQQKSLSELDALFASLQDRAFRGEL